MICLCELGGGIGSNSTDKISLVLACTAAIKGVRLWVLQFCFKYKIATAIVLLWYSCALFIEA